MKYHSFFIAFNFFDTSKGISIFLTNANMFCHLQKMSLVLANFITFAKSLKSNWTNDIFDKIKIHWNNENNVIQKIQLVLADFNNFIILRVRNVSLLLNFIVFHNVCGIFVFNLNGPSKGNPQSGKSSFQKWCYFVRPDANYSFFGVSNRQFFNQNRLFYSVCGPCKIKLFVYFFSSPFWSKTGIPKTLLKQAKIVKNATVRALFRMFLL